MSKVIIIDFFTRENEILKIMYRAPTIMNTFIIRNSITLGYLRLSLIAKTVPAAS